MIYSDRLRFRSEYSIVTDIATASAVRTFLIPETLDLTLFFPDALVPSYSRLLFLTLHRSPA